MKKYSWQRGSLQGLPSNQACGPQYVNVEYWILMNYFRRQIVLIRLNTSLICKWFNCRFVSTFHLHLCICYGYLYQSCKLIHTYVYESSLTFMKSSLLLSSVQYFWPTFSICNGLSRDHLVYAPSWWETMLQCNVVSHWLAALTKWSQDLSSSSKIWNAFQYLVYFLNCNVLNKDYNS